MGGLEEDGMSGFRDGISGIVHRAGKLRVRAGACFLVMAKSEREKLGLENPVVHDTDMAVRQRLAVRNLIRQDNEKNK